MAYLEWSKQNNKGSGYQVQWLSAEESRDNKTDSRVQTCSTNMFNMFMLLLEVICMVKVLAGLQAPDHKKRRFHSKQETFTTANDPQQWKRSTSSLMLKDHLAGMPRVSSRCLLGFLSDLGFHAQYTLIGCITDKGILEPTPSTCVAESRKCL